VPQQPKEQPQALDPPMVPFAVTGIVVWAVLGLALLPLHGWLARHGHTNWLSICLAGFLLGFVGLAVMIRHDRQRRIRRATKG
jgi:drug/metabolite transporter (DMT)-like permease